MKKSAILAAFYWMCLSDGEDRTVPTWTTPGIKDAILDAYDQDKSRIFSPVMLE